MPDEMRHAREKEDMAQGQLEGSTTPAKLVYPVPKQKEACDLYYGGKYKFVLA